MNQFINNYLFNRKTQSKKIEFLVEKILGLKAERLLGHNRFMSRPFVLFGVNHSESDQFIELILIDDVTYHVTYKPNNGVKIIRDKTFTVYIDNDSIYFNLLVIFFRNFLIEDISYEIQNDYHKTLYFLENYTTGELIEKNTHSFIVNKLVVDDVRDFVLNHIKRFSYESLCKLDKEISQFDEGRLLRKA